MTKTSITIEYKRTLQSMAATMCATLDGHPARLTGIYNPFATVWSNANTRGVKFAWETIANVLQNNQGEFKSQ